ncbi:uncharacterized protein DFL_009296 [Arthrobotrys flagrans]|uniref:Uncharacterized protein n=1 Tax=Arthrobotrys flagrans TaxID=97331 RepID=A0A436ZRK9_ARTFL|nr:hypothetical protein DFL_009296 [Arthrobotrys flagrans]
MDERLKREPYLLGDQKVIGIDLSRFHTVSKEPSALNIRELDVCSIPMTYSNENCERFSKWLGTIGPRLEYLNLDLNRPERFLLPTSLKLSNLKALRISYATIDFNNFKAFLNHSRLTLETLILERFEFVNNNPERCFQFLKYARQTLFNLKFLMMDITTKLHDPYFGIYMTTHGWGPASIANGGIEHSHKYASFFLQNLAAQIDANYQPEDLWDSLANLRTQDYSGALRINHYDGVDYDFDSEDDEDDRDYVYNPFRRHEEDDDDGTLGDGDGDDSDYENEAWNYETDDELEYWSDYESD